MMGADMAFTTIARLSAAEDPWAELILWLGEQRTRNASWGGDDLQLIHLIAFQTAMVNLPVMAGGQK